MLQVHATLPILQCHVLSMDRYSPNNTFAACKQKDLALCVTAVHRTASLVVRRCPQPARPLRPLISAVLTNLAAPIPRETCKNRGTGHRSNDPHMSKLYSNRSRSARCQRAAGVITTYIASRIVQCFIGVKHRHQIQVPMHQVLLDA